MNHRRVAYALVAMLGWAATVAATPLVVAVDTSRSLKTADLDVARRLLDSVLQDLPDGTTAGLLAFADEPSWIVEPGAAPAAVRAKLSALRPEGHHTLLRDAVFVATRELAGGGVVVLVSDGRDENSATTIDDIARLGSEQGIRILTLALGERVDEKALRRLALLTDGKHLGSAAQVRPDALAKAIRAALSTTAPQAAPKPTADASPRQPPATIPTAPAPASAPVETAGLPDWLLPVSVVLLVLAALVVFFKRPTRREPAASSTMLGLADLPEPPLPRIQAQPEPIREDTLPAIVLPEAEDEDAHAVRAAAASGKVASAALSGESVLDPSVFQKSPLGANIERTAVLDEQALLIVRSPGSPPRTFTLSRSEIFAVGRAPDVNTLMLADPALSAQHVKFVPREGEHWVVDLGTTNGTWVNSEKVKTKRLRSGDVVRAGQVEMEFRISLKRVG